MLTNCKIFTAKSAGFCFGVDRAVKIVYNKLNNYDNLVTLGPIIHNNNVVMDLEAKGVRAISDVSQVTEGQPVVIRSHGVGLDVYEELETKNAVVIDATCPFVERIHKLARKYSDEGYVVLIAGDEKHPEVMGIRGHCKGKSYVFSDVSKLLKIAEEIGNEKVAVVSQTTFNLAVWNECVLKIGEIFPDAQVNNTICNATAERQREARELAKQSDLMIIVGGRHSSNTLKLKNVCEEYCRCYLIEGAEELRSIDFSGLEFIGISAGASTPAYIIKEVQNTMSEILLNEEEFDFAEALEQSFKKIYTGARVTGYITTVNNSEVTVDIGTKHTGIIPASELTDDPSLKPEDVVKVGDEIEVIVLKISDQDGLVTLSKKKVDAQKGFEEIIKAKEEGTVLTGTVTNVVKGGVLVIANGVKVFVPASQATSRRDDKLEELLKKSVDFKIIDVNEARQRAVGSIRAVTKEARAAAKAEFFEGVEVGAEVEGTVKSVLDYGVFVDLGGVDGLIRKPDLTWGRIKHPSEVVAVGDKIVVTIKDVDKENGKVSLSYKKESENPWAMFEAKYNKDDVVSVKVVSITSFGAFAQIMDGIDGLIHISQIANKRVNNVADILKVGDVVDAQIIEIDAEQKRISLSMRALLPEEEVAEEAAEEAVEATEE
ncbi:MAG: bifunctional 4-hydroxy-3-methylbut-2-enyl diphosphate reductase/30S ribosomal protein S1 [Oscillospiraceae bacterium]|nr:bifunctional 4-hydroxy-3-methylbut-2-enyl diphosphate reductase/30S ribosomal protein S1 [Oscillospiraceae bacterium]